MGVGGGAGVGGVGGLGAVVGAGLGGVGGVGVGVGATVVGAGAGAHQRPPQPLQLASLPPHHPPDEQSPLPVSQPPPDDTRFCLRSPKAGKASKAIEMVLCTGSMAMSKGSTMASRCVCKSLRS